MHGVLKLQPGTRVHHWTLLGRSVPATPLSGRKRPLWYCRCDCGTEKLVLEQNLRLALRADRGGSRSCDCLAVESATKHGNAAHQRPSPEYMAWIAAKKRCNNPGNASYRHYGGRGIRMCARWAESFEAFLRDMGPRPGLGYSLDRIDPHGNYEPGNCRWVVAKVQGRNKRRNRWYEFEGQPALLVDIANFLGVSRDQARSLERRGLLPARRLSRAPIVSDAIEPLVLDLNQVPTLSSFNAGEVSRD